MKVTTVRFSSDVWRLLEVEAELGGVSVAQYIREAALTRASAAAACRGQDPLAALAATAQMPSELAPGQSRADLASVHQAAA